jgi:hypothetical protein
MVDPVTALLGGNLKKKQKVTCMSLIIDFVSVFIQGWRPGLVSYCFEALFSTLQRQAFVFFPVFFVLINPYCCELKKMDVMMCIAFWVIFFLCISFHLLLGNDKKINFDEPFANSNCY